MRPRMRRETRRPLRRTSRTTRRRERDRHALAPTLRRQARRPVSSRSAWTVGQSSRPRSRMPTTSMSRLRFFVGRVASFLQVRAQGVLTNSSNADTSRPELGDERLRERPSALKRDHHIVNGQILHGRLNLTRLGSMGARSESNAQCSVSAPTSHVPRDTRRGSSPGQLTRGAQEPVFPGCQAEALEEGHAAAKTHQNGMSSLGSAATGSAAANSLLRLMKSTSLTSTL